MEHSSLVWGNEKELAKRRAFQRMKQPAERYNNEQDWVFQDLKEAVVEKLKTRLER